MLSTNEVLQILNKNEKKYTTEQAKNIKLLLYQLGEIAYLQFKNIKNDKTENRSIVYTGIHRRAS